MILVLDPNFRADRLPEQRPADLRGRRHHLVDEAGRLLQGDCRDGGDHGRPYEGAAGIQGEIPTGLKSGFPLGKSPTLRDYFGAVSRGEAGDETAFSGFGRRSLPTWPDAGANATAFRSRRLRSPATASTLGQPVRVEVYPRPVESWLEVQIALARLDFSCGAIDGVAGAQSASALRAFQEHEENLAGGHPGQLNDRDLARAPGVRSSIALLGPRSP